MRSNNPFMNRCPYCKASPDCRRVMGRTCTSGLHRNATPVSGVGLVGIFVVALIGGSGAVHETKAQDLRKNIKIENIHVALSPQGPVVLLEADDRSIPIFVDPTVAGSIEGALSGRKFPRPLSHDLMHTILDGYGGKVTRVVISLKDQIYYGELTVMMNGQTKMFDSRSSDAIALAVHFQAPIFVGRELLEKAGQERAGEPPNTLL